MMILHLGGVFGDKEATLNRFRENYAKLPENVKKRLVLENDDVSWSVHDLLSICEELNIPLVLDFHHHNIIFDADRLREGTKDIVDLFPRILATWKRKNITPKMHYSEPTPSAITARQRRKHNPRVATLPPCPPDMDLMIEAKDKEQAVFELMRVFKLPGYDTFNDMIPHVRKDDNKPVRTPKKKVSKKKAKKTKDDGDEHEEAEEAGETAEGAAQEVVADEEVGMGGPEGRVYWPPGMEHWLRPMKKVVKPKEPKVEGDSEKKMAPAQKKKAAADAAAKEGAKVDEEVHANGIKEEEDTVAVTPTPASKKAKSLAKPKANGTKKAAANKKGSKSAKSVELPPITDDDDDEEGDNTMSDLDDEEEEDEKAAAKKAKMVGARKGSVKRQSRRAEKVNYAEDGGEGDE